jgi:hypothetical protein
LIQSGSIQSCLAAQKRFLLFKIKFKNLKKNSTVFGENVEELHTID